MREGDGYSCRDVPRIERRKRVLREPLARKSMKPRLDVSHIER